jgi:Trk K+ transport system NAD-binding subunit
VNQTTSSGAQDAQSRSPFDPRGYRPSWRWGAALLLFAAALLGLSSGVSLTQRPDIESAGLLTKAYYSLGLFVVGGLDLGTPIGGPLTGRIMLWTAFFGAPLLMASAVIDAVLKAMAPQRWQLRRLRKHIVIVGAGELTTSYLRLLRKHEPRTRVVVVDEAVEPVRIRELQETFGVTLVSGDISHDFLLRELQLAKARQIIFLGDNDFQAYEAASKVLRLFPNLRNKVVLHCHNLRFMRSMHDTSVAKFSTTFNSYHLAARRLVEQTLLEHFRTTRSRDVVVIAGFGRFGQTVMEELQASAEEELEKVILIDIDADRRVLVAEEQQRLGGNYERLILQGDISHPEVWQRLQELADLSVEEPTVILGTGQAEDNLRTALWVKQQFPNALVFARTNDVSELALEVGREHGINAFSIKQLVEDNLAASWLRPNAEKRG